MKRGLYLIAIIVCSAVFTFSTINAEDAYYWWNEPEEFLLEEELSATEDKLLIIISKFADDTAQFLPAYCDSMIAPTSDSADDSLYIWSTSNYYKTVSWNQYVQTGTVNDDLGIYITAPITFQE